jgi:hypothetical protein
MIFNQPLLALKFEQGDDMRRAGQLQSQSETVLPLAQKMSGKRHLCGVSIRISEYQSGKDGRCQTVLDPA